MRRITVFILALIALAYPATTVAHPTTRGKGTLCVLHAKLSARNEVPPTTSRLTGQVEIKVRRDGTVQFKYKLKNPAHEEVTAGHIHQGAVGTNGPIVAFLFSGPPTTAKHLKGKGTTTFTSASGLTGAQLCSGPAGFYVNFHTTQFPGGATRGQLR
jgi:CHRD domain